MQKKSRKRSTNPTVAGNKSALSAGSDENSIEIDKPQEDTSRRDFLKKSALAAGALVTLQSATKGAGTEGQPQTSTVSKGVSDGSLILFIPEEIRQVEKLLNTMERNAALRKQFVSAPATVLSRYGLVSGDSQGNISNANRIFLSIVTNKGLMKWLEQNKPIGEPPAEVTEVFKRWAAAKGPMDLPAGYAASVVKEFARNEEFMRGFISRLADDPAFKATLPAGIGKEELVVLTTAGIRAAAEGAAVGKLPQLNSAGRTLGLSVVAGPQNAIFVLVPAVALAVILVAVVIHLACWVTGPTDANRVGADPAIRPVLRDLSIELSQLMATGVR